MQFAAGGQSKAQKRQPRLLGLAVWNHFNSANDKRAVFFLQRRFSMQINEKNIFGTLVCLQPFFLKGFHKVSWQRWCLSLA